jgi:hypothetical protein
MLGSDADGVQETAPDGDEQDRHDMRLNRLDGKLKALAGEPTPVEARASRTQKLLTRRSTFASKHSFPESGRAAAALERLQIPRSVSLRFRARLDEAVNPLEKSAVDAVASGEISRRSAGVVDAILWGSTLT